MSSSTSIDLSLNEIHTEPTIGLLFICFGYNRFSVVSCCYSFMTDRFFSFRVLFFNFHLKYKFDIIFSSSLSHHISVRFLFIESEYVELWCYYSTDSVSMWNYFIIFSFLNVIDIWHECYCIFKRKKNILLLL